MTFVLLADGDYYANVTLNGTGNTWNGSFIDLPVYKGGKAVVYSVKELTVLNYNSNVTNSSVNEYPRKTQRTQTFSVNSVDHSTTFLGCAGRPTVFRRRAGRRRACWPTCCAAVSGSVCSPL